MAEAGAPDDPGSADATPPASTDDRDAEVEAKKQFTLLQDRLRRLPGATGAKLRGRFALALLAQPWAVETPYGRLSFVSLGKGPASRAGSLFTKQPATIAWIDRFLPNSVFWDIGANVGVFSLYAARRGDTQVVAFEPAAVNYFVLAANCEINGLDDRVTCLLVGVGKEKSIARLETSQLDPGHSFSFKGFRARPYPGRQAAPILSMDQLVEEFGLAAPHYLKIDVPGLTEEIIAGGARLLRHPDLRELHVECGLESRGGRRLAAALAELGFLPLHTDSHGGSADVTFARR